MPYCPECGKKVSITDKRCSKCGTKLSKEFFDDIPNANEFVSELKDNAPNLKERKYHNIEFALAIITIVLTVYAISLINLNYVDSETVSLILLLLLIGVIAAIIIRYYAKFGAIILLLVGFILILIGVLNAPLPIIFYIITAVAAFFIN